MSDAKDLISKESFVEKRRLCKRVCWENAFVQTGWHAETNVFAMFRS